MFTIKTKKLLILLPIFAIFSSRLQPMERAILDESQRLAHEALQSFRGRAMKLFGSDEDETNPYAGFAITLEEARTSNMLNGVLEPQEVFVAAKTANMTQQIRRTITQQEAKSLVESVVWEPAKALKLSNVKRSELKTLVHIMELIVATQQNQYDTLHIISKYIKDISLQQQSDLLVAANFLGIIDAVRAFTNSISNAIIPQFSFGLKPKLARQFSFAQIDDLNKLVGSQIISKLETWEKIQELDFDSDTRCLTMTPSGSHIVVGCHGGTTHILEKHEKFQPSVVLAGDGPVQCVATTPNCSHIVTGYRDNHVAQVWTRQIDGSYTGQPLNGHTNTVSLTAITSDASQIITGDRNGNILHWTLCDGAWQSTILFPRKTDRSPMDQPTSIAMTPDGSCIAVAYFFGEIQIATQKYDDTYTIQEAPCRGNSVTMTADGLTLFCSDYSKGVQKLLRHKTGFCIDKSHIAQLDIFTNISTCCNGTRFATSDRPAKVCTQQIDGSYATSYPLNHFAKHIAITADGSCLAAIDEEKAHLWRATVSPRAAIDTTLEQALFAEHCLLRRPEDEKWDIRQEGRIMKLLRWIARKPSMAPAYRETFEQIKKEQPELANYLRKFILVD
jgi:WD40 repeat protein